MIKVKYGFWGDRYVVTDWAEQRALTFEEKAALGLILRVQVGDDPAYFIDSTTGARVSEPAPYSVPENLRRPK